MGIRAKNTLIKRSDFIKLAVSKPAIAAKQLKSLAVGLENCRNISDSVKALQEILYISERTVFNDLIK